MKKYLAVIIIINIIVSCATRITDMDIKRIEVSVTDLSGNRAEAFLPNSVYSVDFMVTDSNSMEYQNPNYRNFKIYDLHKLIIKQQAFFSVRLKTPLETFHSVDTNAYSFNLSVKDNPYQILSHEYPLDWENYNTIDFSGKNGNDGEDGDNGNSASGDTSDSVTGSNGKDGTNGKNGFRGKDTELLVLKYKYGDSEKLLFYELNRKQLFITEIKSIAIDTSGGSGGQGGAGGNGGRGTAFVDEVTEEVIEPGIPGIPGDGGNGGNGGSGGDLVLSAADPNIFDYIQPVTSGGQGGLTGKSGKSYDSENLIIYRGDRGKTGRNGWNGEIQYRVLKEEEINLILNSIIEKGFEKSKIIF